MAFSRAQIEALAQPGYDPYEHDTGWFGSSIVKSVGKAVSGAAKGVAKGVSGAAKGVVSAADAVGSTLGKVPIVGTGLKGLVTVTLGPYQSMLGVLSGERIDTAVLKNLKSQVGAAKDIAPYVQTVISFVPGVGQGISGGMSAALALAEGKPITEAVLAATKGALPGGPLAAAAFDAATAVVQGKGLTDVAMAAVPLPPAQKDLLRQSLAVAKDIAAGKKVDKILLDRANDNLKRLPLNVQKAAQVGIALAQGKNIQATALKAGASVLGNTMKLPTQTSLLGATKLGIQKASGAAQALKNGSPLLKQALVNAGTGIRSGSPEHLGFSTAITVLKNTAGNQVALGAARRALPTESARRAFDTAIGSVAKTVAKNPGALAQRAGSTFVPTMGKAQGKITPYTPNLEHAITTFQKNPALMTENPMLLANKLGTGVQTVMQAIEKAGSQRLLPWRSLSPRAVQFIRRFNPNTNVGLLSHGTNDTAGLDESGTKYIVEKGDSPFKIALKLTGNGNRWVELKPLNKDKKPTIDKNVWVGEVLTIPPSWQKPVIKTPQVSPGPAVATQPKPQAPTVQAPTAAPALSVAPGILQAKAILVAWSKSDGINQAGVSDYGARAEDLSTTFGPRDKTQLMAFQNWSNKSGGARLVVDGILGPKSLAALQNWAETRAAAASTAASPIVTPNVVISGIPNSAPPFIPAPRETATPVITPPKPALPPAVTVSTPDGSVSVSVPPASAIPAVTPAPALPALPAVATPGQPATAESVAATAPPPNNKFGPAMAGAAVGGTLFGLPGAIIGGIAGAAMS